MLFGTNNIMSAVNEIMNVSTILEKKKFMLDLLNFNCDQAYCRHKL